jgi:hypothetical protein
VALLAAPAAHARVDDGIPAPRARTVVRHAESPPQPWPSVDPRAVPKEDSAVPAVVSRPDEGLFGWGAQEMAFAGLIFAVTLFSAGLLLTIREARRIA